MYNHTGLQGRLTADPELRYTQQGTAITSFTLASDTGRKTKDGGQSSGSDFADPGYSEGSGDFTEIEDNGDLPF